MANSKLVKDLVKQIEKISTKLKIEPYELKKVQFMELSGVSEWQLRSVGGYATLLNTYFPFPEKNLGDVELNKQRKAYVSKLEKQFGSWESFSEQLTDSLVSVIGKSKIDPVILNQKATNAYLKAFSKPVQHDGSPRSVVALWTDHHFGQTITKEEVGGKNEWNWQIGARRLGMLVDQIATYKIELRHLHEELVIFWGGDNISGEIHDGSFYDMVTHQVNGAFKYYVAALEYLKPFYKKIRVYGVPGNHSRMVNTAPERAMSDKYNSYENIILFSLSQYFAKDSIISVFVPKSPEVEFVVQGHKYYGTHSDTVFYTGNPGKAINTLKIEQQILRINAEELRHNRKPFDAFLFGHVHQPAHFQINSGAQVLINGTLMGTDQFAHSIGIQSSSPVQVLFEVNKNYSVGDCRWIHANNADSEARYEKIIKPFNYELVAEKII